MTMRKYTDEELRAVRKRRGGELVAWRKKHPLSPEQRAAKSATMRRRWATMTDDVRERTCAKMSASAKALMADPERRRRVSEASRQAWRDSGYGARYEMTEEIRRKISDAQKGKRPEWTKDTKKHQAALAKMAATKKEQFQETGIDNHPWFRPDVRALALANSAKECAVNPLRGKFETNVHAKDWHLRSPGGEEFCFRNLRHFIRNHRHLFSARQLEVRKKNGTTRVEACLYQLSPRRKHRARRSQGWTWIDYTKESTCPNQT